ncbi:MAG: alanine dehydrogenase [Gammaproteobacteria bacterium]|nr:MAG: alanine dehydrogenase [Gammaproteobacteria bacterium]
MLVGVPKEIKNREYRVGMVPAGVHELIVHGHQVLVEQDAGSGIGVSDADYRAAGAEVAGTAAEIYQRAELIVKVKEPLAEERAQLKPGQVLFTYLHLAPDRPQTEDLINSGATCIAYETVTDPHGGLPLLAPMSEVAGRMSVQVGAHTLEEEHGGRGVLLGGVPGVEPGHVVIIGGGVVGSNAALVALGMGARVTVVDRSIPVLRRLEAEFGSHLTTVFSTQHVIEEQVTNADLIIGAVLVPGAAAPHLVSADMVRAMRPGAVVVDVAIDQGGCFETARPTTHDDPIYTVDDVVHYCVTNMPGAVPRTSTFGLTNATLPFVLALAGKGAQQALADDVHLRNGLNVHAGQVTCEGVAESLGYPYVEPMRAIAG